MPTRATPIKEIRLKNRTLTQMMEECDRARTCNAFTSTGVLMHVDTGPETFDTVGTMDDDDDDDDDDEDEDDY
eukprot:jgi/Bigna1/128457/aug1.6_g3165